MVSPQCKREAVEVLTAERAMGVTRACGLVGISRSLYRYQRRRPAALELRGRIAELAAMKPSAIIVNTSRGPVIDEKAMTAALSAGKLFGAGLDVFDEEPTPPDNPLLKLDNVVLTAHLAGPTFESNITRLRNGFDNVQRVARGEPALWVVPELLEQA